MFQVRSQKKLYFWVKINLLLFFALGGSVLAWRYARIEAQPNRGVVKAPESVQIVSHPEIPPAMHRFDRQYFSVMLPETYEEKERDIAILKGTTLREQAYFTDTKGALRKVAVTIDERSNIALTDLTGYTYRKTHTQQYDEQKRVIQQQDIVLFEKHTSPYELVAFLPHDHRFMASIALVSVSETPEKLIDDFLEILSLFQWAK